jgi:hypothetical protein
MNREIMERPSLLFFWANRIVPKRLKATRRPPMIATKRRRGVRKAETIQAPLKAIEANPGLAGKMPGSGVTSHSGMGDNLSEIVV